LLCTPILKSAWNIGLVACIVWSVAKVTIWTLKVGSDRLCWLLG
jgi:hypothetical protein